MQKKPKMENKNKPEKLFLEWLYSKLMQINTFIKKCANEVQVFFNKTDVSFWQQTVYGIGFARQSKTISGTF